MAIEPYENTPGTLRDPATEGFDIVPNDGADLAKVPRSVYVGVGGDIKVDTLRGTTLTFKNVISGSCLPVRVRKVYATGTAATDMIGLY
ncbi:MAG: hypothetical protein OEX12_15275 [Gammaproteobacteria bacterium]|nr:hypothetical protein [Gammaproteobacteria bacterium]